TDDVLVRMKELAEQASTESYSIEQRAIMDEEFQQLISEIDRISANTEFNGLKLLDDETGALSVHLGSSETIDLAAEDMSASGLGIGGTKHQVTMFTSVQVSNINDTLSSAGAGTVRIMFSGSDMQTSFSVTLTADDDTLDEVVDKVNAASRAVTGEEYDMASIVYDETNKTYGIKLSTMYGSAENEIKISGAAGILSSANFTESQAASGSQISIADATSATGALNTITEAIETKDSFRARLGYLMNRLEAATNVNDIQAENLLAAESRISDVDVAQEMAAMTRYQVLAQAGMSMLGQANTMPQMALSLLQ
ncbi:MAG: flagellin, partial [Planctomycetota bacterium]